MSYSGDAAEQVVRMTLESGEVAVKLAGEGAKQLAILLYAVLRDQKKTRGKTRLTNMLRSGKELKVFAVKDADLQKFCKAAKKYGVLYCVLKDRDAKDGITDIMVRAEDASKINRIFERYGLSTVDMASVRSEAERGQGAEGAAANQDGPTALLALPPAVDLDGQPLDIPEPDMDAFLDAALSQPPEEPVPVRGGSIPLGDGSERDQDVFMNILLALPPAREEEQTENPTEARTEKSRQSEPISKPNGPTAQGFSEPPEHFRPSVRQELNDIRAEQRKEAADNSRSRAEPQKLVQHKAPRKKKSRKIKER